MTQAGTFSFLACSRTHRNTVVRNRTVVLVVDPAKAFGRPAPFFCRMKIILNSLLTFVNSGFKMDFATQFARGKFRGKRMNVNHINAVTKVSYRTCVVNGVTLGTDGFIAFVVPEGCTSVASDENFKRLADVWKQYDVPPAPALVGGVHKEYGEFYRRIGKQFINERYYRCFCGDGVVFQSSGKHKAILVFDGDRRIGMIMPVLFDTFEDALKEEPTDQEVFAPIAGPENGWYAQSDAVMRQRIAEAEKELADLKSQRADIEDEISEVESSLAGMRGAATL